MKKNYLFLVGFLSLFLASCTTTNPELSSSVDIESVSSSESISLPEESSAEVEALSVEAYFPFEADVAYSYAGDGNEYVSYQKYPQYYENNRIQYVTKNAGSHFIEVLELEEGAITQVFRRDETYFRENMLDQTRDESSTILLKEPLEIGNNWDNSEITALDIEIETMVGTFPSLEVTTTEKDTITKRYYAEGIGLVKEIYTDTNGSYEMTATLESREEGTAETVVLRTYYPDRNVMGLEVAEVNIAFFTNDVTRKVIAELFKHIPGVDYGQVIPEGTQIKSLCLNEDGRVYVDFSQELVNDLNAGSSAEKLLLQSIVNTIGSYYGVEEVVLTVENAPYKSGHIEMNEGEPFYVEMNSVLE